MGRSILVVDDETAVTLALEAFFRSRGYEVLRAFYGAEALKRIEQDRPTVAVVDLYMPGMNGIAVLEKVREQFPEVKTLVITGYADKYRSDLERLKPDALQLKPVSLEQLVNTVENLMNK